MLYVLAVGRDMEKSFPLYKEFVDTLLKAFSDTQVYFYENNSKDKTKELLADYAATNSSFHLTMENLTHDELLRLSRASRLNNDPNRMACIAFARNKLLDAIEPLIKEDDIVLWIDPDMHKIPLMDILIHWIRNFPKGVDALFANGLSVNGKYYDAFAYRDKKWLISVELMGDGPWRQNCYNEIQRVIPMDSQLIPVYSAFGGLALYRGTSIKGSRYCGEVNAEYDWYVKSLRKIQPNHPNFCFMRENKIPENIDSRIQGVYLFDKKGDPDALFYKHCSDYNFPAICEHVVFHASMMRKGHNKLFICPSLVYFSDHWA